MSDKPTVFGESLARKLRDHIRRPERNPQIPTPYQTPQRPAILWCKPKAGYASGNTWTFTPCRQDGTENESDTLMTLYLSWPSGSTPSGIVLTSTQAHPYIPFWDEAAGEYRGLVLGLGGWGTNVTPAELTGTGATANTDTWSIASPPAGTDGVKYTASRLYWSGTTGDPVYQFIRTPTFDSSGRLVAVSAEVRSTAFSTGTCEA